MLDVAPESSGNRFREKRFQLFIELIKSSGIRGRAVEVLDVGGTMKYWQPRLPKLEGIDVNIRLLNLNEVETSDARFKSVAGDARHMPEFPDNAFDIVHSNSVIEHVGRWSDMKAMASEVRRVAPAHFIQTPNFWFPIEPHCRTAFFHWLPEPIRLKIVTSRPLGFWPKAQGVDAGMHRVESALLLNRAMFSFLFPDSRIENEKFLGLTKSFMAIRSNAMAS